MNSLNGELTVEELLSSAREEDISVAFSSHGSNGRKGTQIKGETVSDEPYSSDYDVEIGDDPIDRSCEKYEIDSI
jgi:hypothetical protein